MAFSHSVVEKLTYTAGGQSPTTTNSYSKTGGAEINLSEEVVTSDPITTATTIAGFNGPDTAANTQSLIFQWDQTDAQSTAASVPSGYLKDQGGNVICNLVRGEPFIWVEGNDTKWGSNPLTNAITALDFEAHTGGAVTATGTLTARVLYEP